VIKVVLLAGDGGISDSPENRQCDVQVTASIQRLCSSPARALSSHCERTTAGDNEQPAAVAHAKADVPALLWSEDSAQLYTVKSDGIHVIIIRGTGKAGDRHHRRLQFQHYQRLHIKATNTVCFRTRSLPASVY